MFGAMIAVSQVIIYTGGPLVPELLSDMPKFYEYDGTTGEQLRDSNGSPLQNEKIRLYFLLAQAAGILFIIIGLGAVFVWYVEDYGMARRGAAFGIFSKIILYGIILYIIPYVWDVAAMGIEQVSLYLMNPFGDSPPSERTAEMWQNMGGVIPSDAFDIIKWGQALSSPGEIGQALLVNVFMALFKGMAVMFMTVMMFILSVIRIELTMVLIIAMPIILAFKLIPKFSDVSDMLIKNLVGLMIAPIFSGLVLGVGFAYIDAEQMPALQNWFAQLSIGFLVVFFPVMLAPMLGFLSTQVGQMMSTAMQGATQMGTGAISGMMGGISNASQGMSNMAGSAVGAAVGGAAGSAAGNIATSAATNSLTSGMAPNISKMDKFKTFAKAGLMGAVGGAAGGMASAVGQQVRAPGIGKEVSSSINSGITS